MKSFGVAALLAWSLPLAAQWPAAGKRNHPQAISDTGYAARLQATVSGTPGYTGAPTGGGQAPRAAALIVGGYWYPAPPPLVLFAPPLFAPAPVIVNQITQLEKHPTEAPDSASRSESGSGVRIYSAPAPQPAVSEEPAGSNAAKPAFYLVAFTDHSIQTALALWRENGKLHYLTPQGGHKTAPLESFDPELTGQLNRERGLEFTLRGK